MSMQTLTILQLAGVFMAYTLVVLVLPAIVLGPAVAHRRLAERMLCYFLVGNGYVMLVVTVLQMLHLSHTLTLIPATLVPAFFVWKRLRRISLARGADALGSAARRLLRGSMGVKCAFAHLGAGIVRLFRRTGKRLWEECHRHGVAWLLLIGVAAACLYLFGTQIVTHYGYTASDLTLHNSWINAMDHNRFYADGIYPFGFHCIVLYLHKVFFLDTYVVLRVFGPVVAVYLFGMLAAFLLLIGRVRFLGPVAVLAWLFFGGFQEGVRYRYVSALPQEYGMLFVLPCVYFLIACIAARRQECQSGIHGSGAGKRIQDGSMGKRMRGSSTEKRMCDARYCAVMFALALCMALSVHFYDAAIAGILCIAVAIGFCAWCFRWRYLRLILAAGVAAVAVAVLPMGVALAEGLPLQGSLEWGLGVIHGTIPDDTLDNTEEETELYETEEELTEISETEIVTEISNIKELISIIGTFNELEMPDKENTIDRPKVLEIEDGSIKIQNREDLQEKLLLEPNPQKIRGDTKKEKTASLSIGRKFLHIMTQVKKAGKTLCTVIRDDVFTASFAYLTYAVGIALFVLLALGFLMLVTRQRIYGATMVSMALGAGFLLVLLAAGRLGLPELMQPERGVIYLAYFLPVVFTLAVDGICDFAARILCVRCKKGTSLQSASEAKQVQTAHIHLPGRHQMVRNILAAACSVALAIAVVVFTPPAAPVSVEALETNGAVLCLTNLLRDEPDGTWTLVSASDESAMMADHGYHYEIYDLLYGMEGANPYTYERIPTAKVYFFIEKVPLDYSGTYEGSGQPVSEAGAAHALPQEHDIRAYYTENRWILMSRLWYWAQTYAAIYPNDMTVYYEDEDFCCYCLTQNTYSLFNLAVDYYYNTIDWDAEGGGA